MKPARAAVATQAPPAHVAVVEAELDFDFGEELAPQPPKRPEQGWLQEPGGVKAAILRWLEEQV